MPRAFVAASSQYLSAANPVSDEPLALSARGKTSDVTNIVPLVQVGQTSGAFRKWSLRMAGNVAGDPITMLSQHTGGSGQAVSPTGYSAGVWCAALGRTPTSSDRRARINGGTDGTNATSIDINTPSVMWIGSSTLQAGTQFYGDVEIAEVGVWEAALLEREATALALFAPHRVRPTSLRACLRLINGTPRDISRSRLAVTDNGPSTQGGRHPRVFS